MYGRVGVIYDLYVTLHAALSSFTLMSCTGASAEGTRPPGAASVLSMRPSCTGQGTAGIRPAAEGSDSLESLISFQALVVATLPARQARHHIASVSAAVNIHTTLLVLPNFLV